MFFNCTQCGINIEAHEADGGKRLTCPSCNTALQVPAPVVRSGLEIGAFVIDRLLGVGGMGQVWLANQVSMNRWVALKILVPSLTSNPDFVDRFIHEVRTTAKLVHPNIITVYDAGVDKGIYYMAVTYVDGIVLQKALEHDNFPEVEALRIVRGVAEGLAYAWDKFKILHRDIKPENIMVDREGTPKLMDLGISKSLFEDSTLTMTGNIVGSPCYMSPEYARADKNIDFRTDIYSLGATLYHMVTGHLPFDADNAMSVIAKVISDTLIPPDQVNTSLSEECSRLIQIMMSKNPNDRQQSWELLIQDINSAIAGEKPVKPAVVEETVPKPEVTFSKTKQIQILKILLLGAVSLIVIMGVYIFAREGAISKPMADNAAAELHAAFMSVSQEVEAMPSADATGIDAIIGKWQLFIDKYHGYGKEAGEHYIKTAEVNIGLLKKLRKNAVPMK